MALDAVILDIDGTLIDSNGVHVEAWRRAFESRGYRCGADRIFLEVGKGGDQLVPALFGNQVDQEHGDFFRKRQPEEFEKLASKHGLRVFDGARELIEALDSRDLKTCVATSSDKKQLAALEKHSGLAITQLVDVVVNSSDIEKSKPAPDAVHASLKKLKVSPAQAVMIGDTPFDAESAKHAGVICLGVACGGNEPLRLLQSGARRVWRDPRDLLLHLDEALAVASPSHAKLTSKILEQLMRQALQVAKEAIDAGEAPIGAVLLRGDGETVVASGFNELNKTGNSTAHAEMVTFSGAAGKIGSDERDTILVCTLEPCVMCLGAAMQSAVDTIVYGLKAPADSGTARVSPPQSPESQMPRIVPDVLTDESLKLFKRWLKFGNVNPKQRAYVEQLIELNE